MADQSSPMDDASHAQSRPRSEPLVTAKSTTGQVSPRAAVQQVHRAEHLMLHLPLFGRVQLPRPEHLAYYGAITALVALEVIEWPVGVALAVGHALIHQQHSRTMQELGEALEEA